MEIEDQLRGTRLHDIEQKREDIIGSLRINPKNYTDAYINNPDGGCDICIEGFNCRNSALDGDVVKVRLNHHSRWKINHNIIANRWDDWSQDLDPIIEALEQNGKQKSGSKDLNKSDQTPKPCDNVETNATRSRRGKRSVVESNLNVTGSGNKDAKTSKLPSNLPLGISKLEVKHIIHLPFFSRCVQKTGYVCEIVKRNHTGIAGGFLKKHSQEFALFSPTDHRVPRMLIDITQCPSDFPSQPDRYKDVLFVARMLEWAGNKGFAKGELIKIVGDCNKVESRIGTLIVENQIYDHEFPDEAHKELDYLNHLPENWFAQISAGRCDLTNECIFTIDPKTARDLDDALSIKQIAEQIYEVGVHIADVSFFVKELSAVDYHARMRTTSVYLVDRVIPMLPRILCERMCSLNAGEPKLTFSVIWKMDKYGRIIDQWFGRTLIKSCTKLSYEQVQDIIDRPNDISWIQEGLNMPKLHAFDWKTISKSVIMLNKIAQNMRAKRFEDGALRIDQVKIKYELDPDSGFPTGLTIENRTDSNYLVEEFMLLANMSVARRIYQHNQDHAFLRRHPPSSMALMKELKEFCDAKGCVLDITSAGSLQRSLRAILDPTMRKVVSFLLLRSMKNAEYICTGSLSNDEFGFRHFALNAAFYTHFTSPIRRYADVIVHRQLAVALGLEEETLEDIDTLTSMADECTKRKLSSKLISDTSQKLYFNLFVQKAGFCELLACVTRIYDQSFDVILVDYDRNGRVYIDQLKSQLKSFNFVSHYGVRKLELEWQSPTTSENKATKRKKNKNKFSKKHIVDQADDNQIRSRNDLESSPGNFLTDEGMRINESMNNKQVIEVFDVVRVIVTVDAKDITQLKIRLKTPF